MFSKSFFVIALAAIAQLQVVVATPPACLLGAVNQYDDASDIEAVCKSKDATSKIAKLCGGSTKDALAAFADICNDKGVKVSTNVASATASGSASATASGTAGTASATASGSANGTATGSSGSGATGATPTGPTASGSGAAQSTNAASALDFSAAALLAGLGVVAAAL